MTNPLRLLSVGGLLFLAAMSGVVILKHNGSGYEPVSGS